VREGHLNTKPGWDANRLKSEKQRNFEAVTTWTTHNVAMTVVGAHVNAPGGAANGAVCVRFGGADEAVIICNGPLLWSFTDQDAVRGFMRELLDGGQWKDVSLCVVTEVILVDSAWVCFATEKNQSAEIRVKSAVSLPAIPVDALKAVAGNASLVVTTTSERSAGYCATVEAGGSPLFRAVKFTNKWWEGVNGNIEYTKGIVAGASAFEEPEFG
jgi:hypothetical protein